MGRQAKRVYADQDSIRRLESLIDQLPANGQVVLLLKDGSSCDGLVSTRPNVQVFRDAEEHEGINATVQLQRPDVPDWSGHVWLDQARSGRAGRAGRASRLGHGQRELSSAQIVSQL